MLFHFTIPAAYDVRMNDYINCTKFRHQAQRRQCDQLRAMVTVTIDLSHVVENTGSITLYS